MRYLYIPFIAHYDVPSCLSYPAIATVNTTTLAAGNSEEGRGKTGSVYIDYEQNEGLQLIGDVILKKEKINYIA